MFYSYSHVMEFNVGLSLDFRFEFEPVILFSLERCSRDFVLTFRFELELAVLSCNY